MVMAEADTAMAVEDTAMADAPDMAVQDLLTVAELDLAMAVEHDPAAMPAVGVPADTRVAEPTIAVVAAATSEAAEVTLVVAGTAADIGK
jgi:hypothetical protein